MNLETLLVDGVLVIFATYSLWKALFVIDGSLLAWRVTLAEKIFAGIDQTALGLNKLDWCGKLRLKLTELLECAFCLSFWLAVLSLCSLLLGRWLQTSPPWSIARSLGMVLTGLVFVLAATGVLDVLRTYAIRLGSAESQRDDANDPADGA